MMKRLLVLLTGFILLTAQSCEPAPPPPTDNYCAGTVQGTVFNGLTEFVDNATGDSLNTIVGGELSTDRRATVHVFFGSSYCTGTAISPRVVITAGHCGYAVEHDVRIEGKTYHSSKQTVYPDYLAFTEGTNPLGRQSDIQLLHMDEDIPGPYARYGYIHQAMAPHCTSLKAQGWGQDEFPETGPQLRESDYRVKSVNGAKLITEQATWGGICFGDSGGPLYVVETSTGEELLYVVGAASTTADKTCEHGSTHTNVSHFKNWIDANMAPPA